MSRGCGKNKIAQQMPPHQCQDSAEGSRLLTIPSSLLEGELTIGNQRVSKERHQTLEPQEQRSRPFDRPIRPLPLRLQASMCAPFLTGGCQTPALHEIADDLFGGLGLVSGKQGFGWARALRVAGEDPPDGQGNGSKGLPASGATTELQRALALPLPVHGEALPHPLPILPK